MNRMTNFRSAAVATGNAINDSAYDNVKIVADSIDEIAPVGQNLDAILAIDPVAIQANASAAATSEANALASENAAMTSATAAAAAETGAVTSAATAVFSKDLAATSEANASTSETNAAASAVNASNSESAAATSEANAAASEASSANNAVLTAADVVSTGNDVVTVDAAKVATESARDVVLLATDAVDSLLLGAKTSDPTVDNNGDPLEVGAIYYNTTLDPKQFKVWDGSAWNVAVFDASGAVLTFNGRDGAVSLNITDISTALGFTVLEYSQAEKDKLALVEDGATADMTDLEISTLTKDYPEVFTNKTMSSLTNDIHADAVHYEIQATENILRGDVLVATGVADDVVIKVGKRSSADQPVIGIAGVDTANGLTGGAVVSGVMNSMPNPLDWDVGDILYPDNVGGMTVTPDIGAGKFNQPIAYVVKANPAQVAIIVNVHKGHSSADRISYDGTVSGLVATNIQDAVDEVEARVAVNDAKVGVTTEAKVEVANVFTAPQMGSISTANNGSFDMSLSNKFKCTPTADSTLSFTNLANGQGGMIWLDNSGGNIISKDVLVLSDEDLLSNISQSGIYILGYECDGTNVLVTGSMALS